MLLTQGLPGRQPTAQAAGDGPGKDNRVYRLRPDRLGELVNRLRLALTNSPEGRRAVPRKEIAGCFKARVE